VKHDRIEWSKQLLSSGTIAELLNVPVQPVDHPQVQGAARVPASPKETVIEFSPTETDWQDADQLTLYVFIPEGSDASARLRVDSSSTTPGLVGNDYVHCYYRYLHSGWGRIEFPYENMLIFGIPDRWRQVSRVSLSLQGNGTGDFLIGDLVIEKRERVAGPRMTDEELFAALDLSRPELESVRAAAERDGLEAARSALATYMRTRHGPRHGFATSPEPQADYDSTEADQICRHYILQQQLDQEIDWRANPIGYLEWMHAFNRHSFLNTLVEAYLATGDEKYAAKLDYLLSTWLEQNPVPIGNNGGGDPAWETLSAACRIATGNQTWPRIWYALQESPSFREETRISMLKSFYEHAEHLIIYPTGHNWLVAESAAITTVGILFPEFRRAEDWRNTGMERLEREMRYQVYPDGAQFELSPGYHRMCGQLFSNVYDLARRNGHPISDEFARRLEAMYLYTMHITRPDGTRPSLNDASASDISTAPELRHGHALFGRPELAYVASEGKEGVAPDVTSKAFPYAGHYVMRTGWDRDALWALVDAGPYGAAHQHEDKLSLELYAYGTRFILDPGIASYLDDPLTHHFRATSAHNTVLVDGKGQDRRTTVPRSRYRIEEPEPASWASSERLDYLWAEYSDGYSGMEPENAPVHGRLVLFWKPLFWIVWDTLQGTGEHEMSVLWHFGPMLVQAQTGGVVRSNRLGLPNLELLPLGSHDGVEIVCAEQDPMQGWLTVSEPFRQVVPAPVVIYRKKGILPLGCGVVAAPFLSGASSGYAVKSLRDGAVQGGGSYLATTIADSRGASVDVLYANTPCGLTLGRLRASAQGLLLSRGSDGVCEYAAALNCRRASRDDMVLVDSDEAQPLVEIDVSDWGG